MEIKIIVVDTDQREYVHQCLEIAKRSFLAKGESLSHIDRVEFSKYVVCAVQGDVVLGYASIMEGIRYENDLFINQFIVDPCFSNIQKEIRELLIEYILHHSLGRDCVSYEIDSKEKQVIKLLDENGFVVAQRNSNLVDYVYQVKYIRINENMQYTELDKENES